MGQVQAASHASSPPPLAPDGAAPGGASGLAIDPVGAPSTAGAEAGAQLIQQSFLPEPAREATDTWTAAPLFRDAGVRSPVSEPQPTASTREVSEDAVGRLDALLAQGRPDPQQARELFESLSAPERATLLEHRAEALGNLDGAPVELRYAANRQRMEAARDDLQARIEDGGATKRERTRAATLDGLLQDPSRQFLLFDNEADGRIAEVFGDVANADSVAVFVPGMGSTLDNFRFNAKRSENLHERAQRFAQEGAHVATISWLGYDAPANLWRPSGEVFSAEQARAGATALRYTFEGLQLQDDATVTLIGHSYGSTVAGEALQQGLEIDSFLAMGSVGARVNHISEYPSHEAMRFYTMEVPGDFAVRMEFHGRDPNRLDSGFTDLETGPWRPDRAPLPHNDYLLEDSTSLDNAAMLVAGVEDLELQVPSVGRHLSAAVRTVQQRVVEARGTVNQEIDRGQDWVNAQVDLGLKKVNQAIDDGQERVNQAIDTAQEIVNRSIDGWQEGRRRVPLVDGLIDTRVDRAQALWNRAAHVGRATANALIDGAQAAGRARVGSERAVWNGTADLGQAGIDAAHARVEVELEALRKAAGLSGDIARIETSARQEAARHVVRGIQKAVSIGAEAWSRLARRRETD